MTGLLYKEFYTLKRYLKQYITILIMFTLISVYMKSVIYLQSMLSMSLGMLTFTGITYDKMYGWDKLALTMPVSRSGIVLSKYIMSALVSASALIVSSVIGIVIKQFVPVEEGMSDILMVAVVLFGALLLIYAVILPIIYKFGVEKARIMMFGVIAIPIVFITIIVRYIPVPTGFIEFINSHVVLTGLIYLLICILIDVISYFISVHIYNQKEF